jgi:hypothetical protein
LDNFSKSTAPSLLKGSGGREEFLEGKTMSDYLKEKRENSGVISESILESLRVKRSEQASRLVQESQSLQTPSNRKSEEIPRKSETLPAV